MAKRKISNLRAEFNKKKKYLNQVLKELGSDYRIKTPEKLTRKYVDSVKSLGKKVLRDYISGKLSNNDSRTISNRLTSITTSDNTTNTQSKTDVVIVNGKMWVVETGDEIDFNEEEFAELTPDKYKSWLGYNYPNLNVSNLDELEDDFISYIDVAKERLESVLESNTKGAKTLKSLVVGYISDVGEYNFYSTVAKMPHSFWEAVDICSHYDDGYGKDGEENLITRDEFSVNFEKLISMLSTAIYGG